MEMLYKYTDNKNNNYNNNGKKIVTYVEPYLGSNYMCDLNLKQNTDRRNDAFTRNLQNTHTHTN